MAETSDDRLIERMDYYSEKSKEFEDREEAKAWVAVELSREFPDLLEEHAKGLAEEIVRAGFDKNFPKRKEVGKYKKILRGEMHEPFGNGVEAIRAIGTEFHGERWAGMPLKDKYKFLDEIEEIIKNPGKYRNDERYSRIREILRDDKELEEETLMALGVLKRRRGSEKQIARMGTSRLLQRRAGRNIETYWGTGQRRTAAPGTPPGTTPPGTTPPGTTPPGSTPPGTTPPGTTPPGTTPPGTTPPGTTPPGTTPPGYLPQYPRPQLHCPVIVDSEPVKDVHVLVKAKRPIKGAKLKLQDYANAIGLAPNDWMVQRASEVGGNFDALPAASPHKASKEAAEAWIRAQLAAIPGGGITDPGIRDPIVDLIIDHYYAQEENLIYVPLDDWRKDIIDKNKERAKPAGGRLAPLPIPFGLQRETQYLATRLKDQQAIRRTQMQRGTTFTGLQLNATTLPNDVVDRNTYTVFYLNLELGWYQFTADSTVKTVQGDAKFDRWEITRFDQPDRREIYDMIQTAGDVGQRGKIDDRFVRSMQRGVTTHWENQVELFVFGKIKLVAYYHETAKIAETRRETGPQRYQMGATTAAGAAVGGRGGRSAADAGVRALGATGIRSRMGRDVEVRKLAKDPYMLAATNKGKRILNRYARARYSLIFNSINARYRTRADELRTLEERATQARRDLKRLIRQNRRAAGGWRNAMQAYKIGSGQDEDLLNIARSMAAPDGGLAAATAQQMRDARQALQIYLRAREKFFEDFTRETEGGAAALQNYLKEKSVTVSISLARRYRMPVNGADEGELQKALGAYAGELTENFVLRGRTIGHAFMRGLGIMSRGTETMGAAGMNVFQSTFDFIFGPWTWTTLFVLLEFFFVLNYIGYNTVYLWVFPLIGAGFTFLLNFSDSFRPLDWVTHLSSGAIIGYSALLLLIALGALNWSFMNPFWFWIIWGILGFLGLFQFYQTSGWKVVMQGGVIVLLFAFIALGPYSAYYQQALDQVKAPVEIAYRAVSNAVTDVWLLATNPTEWYARQQLVNVRPERPLDFPKGIEVLLLDALPPSVPGGTEFALTAVIKNEGSIKEPARDITVTLGCNQWCDKPPEPDIAQARFSLCHDRDILSRDEFYCGESCGQDTSDSTNLDLDTCINACVAKEAQTIPGTLGAVSRYNCLTKNKEDFTRNYAFINKMERGEATAVTIRGFTAVSEEGRQGEVRLADVLFNLSYRYSTSTSLLTEVMTEKEINRRIQENENVYRNVPSVTKSSPAQLSLNVGPQPLRAGGQSLLLVSVSNTRDESSVLLKRGTKIKITMPKIVGSGLNCGNSRIIEDSVERQVVEYTVPEDATVLAYNFRSIFAFLCDFRVADEAAIGDVKTGLITAEMPGYTFVLTKKKQVPVTPPLGILFDPYQKQCDRCGEGKAEACDVPETECYTLSNREADKGQIGTCYYEFAGTQTPLAPDFLSPQTYLGSPCRSCGKAAKCEQFLVEKTCSEGAGRCKIACEWDDKARRESSVGEVNKNLQCGHLDPNCGVCKEKQVKGVSTIGTTGTSLSACSKLPSNYRTGYEKHKDKIATQLSVFKLEGVSDPQALVAALISKESGWNERAYRAEPQIGDASYGIMQIVPKFHPECDTNKIKAYDVDENLKCGIRFLSENIKECGSVEGALRKYNSGNCNGRTYDTRYVDHIMGTLQDRDFSSGYAQWRSCFQQAQQPAQQPAATTNTCTSCTSSGSVWCTTTTPSETNGFCAPFCPSADETPYYYNPITSTSRCPGTPKKGETSYCANKFATSSLLCREGEGSCKSDAECETIERSVSASRPSEKLLCRKSVSSGVCCFEGDSDSVCLQKFNAWKSR